MPSFLKKNFILLIVTGALIIAALGPTRIREKITDVDTDILFKLRGSRDVCDDIVFIYIDSRDIDELNGWPITRDYYGYLTHILKSAGARVVGIDILFTSANIRYPEYDKDMGHFLRSAQNVCLPFAFSDVTDTFRGHGQSFFLGNNPQFPIDIFRQHTLGIGFSNLPDETVIRHGLCAASYSDSLRPAFGLECARLFLFGAQSTIQFEPQEIIFRDSTLFTIKTDDFYRVRLNHFGDLDKLRSMSLIDLFQMYQKAPEQLNVQGKLVFVGITAPGTAPLKVTPFHSSFPASLAHVTLAENILEQNFIRVSPYILTITIILLFSLIVHFFISFQWQRILLIGAVLAAYILVSVLLFKFSAFALPLLLPLAAAGISAVVTLLFEYRKKSSSEEYLRRMYAEQVETKEQQLSKAQAQMLELSQEKQQLYDDKQKDILRLEKELRDLQASTEPVKVAVGTYEQIIHAPTSKMVSVLHLVEKISSDDIPVLISGETGTGKEVVSRAIHESGKRSSGKFIAVNCGALPETLLESELFGHEKGAFTGAVSPRKGRFELADNGTLFLDEITETSAAFQAKLLRVLQEGTFERLGSERTLKVDVRIIAASSKNIEKQVREELFREDLFWRLNGFQIELPPLRERKDDIPLLATHFIKKHGYDSIASFSERALEVMTGHHWPGNVRELENTIRRAAILAQSDGRTMIQEIDLPHPIQDSARDKFENTYQTLDEQILEILRSLQFSHSSISQTAKALGNKDRGTITEYFRGICFEHLVQADFDLVAAATSVAATSDESVLEKVKSKMTDYVSTVQNDPASTSLYKGLPKKYHAGLEQVIDFMTKNKGRV